MASTAGVDLIYQVPSSALMAPLTRSFVADIKRFVKQQGIDLIRFSVESARMTGRRTICATGLAARGCCLSAPRRRRRVCRGSRGGQGVVQVELQPSADIERQATTSPTPPPSQRYALPDSATPEKPERDRLLSLHYNRGA